jgi:hypothetical protein
MDTPKFRFSLMPALVAVFLGAVLRPALNIFRVDARGLGHEHAQPWRSKARAIADAAGRIAARMFGPALTRLASLSRSPLFSPAMAAVAVILAVVVNHAALFAAPIAMGTLIEGTHTAEFLAWEANLFNRETVAVLSGQNLASGAVVGRVTLGIGRVSIPTVVGTGTGTVSAVFAGPEVEVGNYVLKCTAAVANGGVFSLTTPSGKALPSLTMTPGSGGSTTYTSRHINFTITDSTDFAVDDTFTFVVSTTAPTVIGGTGTGTISALSLGPDAKPGRYQVVCRAAVSNGGDFDVIAPDGTSLGRFLMGTSSGTSASFASRAVNFTLTDATDFIVGNYFDIAVFNQLNGGKAVAWDPTTYDGRHTAVGVLYAATDATAADANGLLITRDAVVVKSALQWGVAITAAQKESAYRDLAKRGVIARDGVTV